MIPIYIECHTCKVTGWLIPSGVPKGWTVEQKPDYLDLYYCNNCSPKVVLPNVLVRKARGVLLSDMR